MEDSRGTLCRYRRVVGSLERLRCGWARQDREGGEGRERAGSSCLFLQGTWRCGESDWPSAGPLSQWLHAGLTQAGFQTVLLETRHVKAALSAMTVKTDRKDACGLAQLLRMGWFQQVHAKSIGSQEIRALLVARKQLLGRLLDVELSIRGILRGFGLKVGQVTRKTFEARIRELVTGQATLERIALDEARRCQPQPRPPSVRGRPLSP